MAMVAERVAFGDRIFVPLGADVDRVFDSAADWVGDGRGGLSNRLWLARALDRKAIDDILRRGLANGTDPLIVAKELHAYLTPEGLSTLTRTPRSGVGNYAARRLARTETSRAFNEGVLQAADANPFIDGAQWNTSGSHEDQDQCDEHARNHSLGMPPGVYLISEFPRIPAHSYCRCFATQWSSRNADDVVRQLRVDSGIDDSNVIQFPRRSSLWDKTVALFRAAKALVTREAA